ncbi:hypothetical protein VTJ49DRAFT_3948 [Mycothermus thermophilus]|uniref:FAD-binding domain-containing protein n=1 Tax=Humicola insolens TaxID=85995 RepID=A0ABR3V6M7_HUMIN
MVTPKKEEGGGGGMVMNTVSWRCWRDLGKVVEVWDAREAGLEDVEGVDLRTRVLPLRGLCEIMVKDLAKFEEEGLTYYDFDKFGWHDANFVMHPEHFYIAAKITPDGLYRITYGEKPGLSDEEYLARLPGIFKQILPGAPSPGEYRVVDFSPYRMHNRCAPRFRVGRVLLAADAAHLCNPWGGLGITGGLVDVGGLCECFAGMWDGRADESILDVYSEKRMEKWRTCVDAVSRANLGRMAMMEKDGDQGTQAESKVSDGAAVRAKLLAGMEMRYDFTQHYRDAK